MNNFSVMGYKTSLVKDGVWCVQISGAVWSWKEWIRKRIILGGSLDATSFCGREFDGNTSGEMQT